MFLGQTGSVCRLLGGETVIVRLKDNREITEYRKYVEVIERDNADFLYVLDLGSRTVHVHLNDMSRENEVYVSLSNGGFVIKGKENIEEFIRAVAIAGDLIREDEDLVVKHRVKFEVPEDGLYSLDLVHISRPVVVKDGKCLGAEGNYNLTDITEWVEVKVELGEGVLVPFDMENLL